jgi:hypothetical protein
MSTELKGGTLDTVNEEFSMYNRDDQQTVINAKPSELAIMIRVALTWDKTPFWRLLKCSS